MAALDWSTVLAAQAPDGSFASFVHLSDGPRPDRNAFVTALVLDCLWTAGAGLYLDRARSRALDFLETCGDGGRYGFYPRGQQPEWMAPPLSDDADDTALVLTALIRAGRLDRTAGWTSLNGPLRPHRIGFLTERSDPWHRVGVYETWLDETAFRNPVDCTVNANILALLFAIGAPEDQTRPIIDMLEAALNWAGPLKARVAKLSPWYPDPLEFVHALSRAARWGNARVAALFEQASRFDWVKKPAPQSQKVCGSSDGRIYWTSPALQAARELSIRVPSFS